MEDFGMDMILDESQENEMELTPDLEVDEVIVDDEKKLDAEGVEAAENVGEDDISGGAQLDNKKTNDELYPSLAEALKEQGLLPNLEEGKTISSADELVAAFKQEITKNEFNDLTDSQKEYLEAVKNGVPDAIIKEKQQTDFTLNKITDEAIENEDNEELRKNLIVDYFRSKEFDEEEAEMLADQQINNGNDIEFAKKARNKIKGDAEIEYQDQVKQIEQSKVKEKEAFDNLTETVLNKGTIGDLKISKELRSSIYSALTKPIEDTAKGTKYNKIAKYQIENPIDFQFKLGYLFEVTKGFSDFGLLSSNKQTERNATKKLDALIKSNSNNSNIGGVSNTIDSEDSFSIDDLILDV